MTSKYVPQLIHLHKTCQLLLIVDHQDYSIQRTDLPDKYYTLEFRSDSFDFEESPKTKEMLILKEDFDGISVSQDISRTNSMKNDAPSHLVICLTKPGRTKMHLLSNYDGNW